MVLRSWTCTLAALVVSAAVLVAAVPVSHRHANSASRSSVSGDEDGSDADDSADPYAGLKDAVAALTVKKQRLQTDATASQTERAAAERDQIEQQTQHLTEANNLRADFTRRARAAERGDYQTAAESTPALPAHFVEVEAEAGAAPPSGTVPARDASEAKRVLAAGRQSEADIKARADLLNELHALEQRRQQTRHELKTVIALATESAEQLAALEATAADDTNR